MLAYKVPIATTVLSVVSFAFKPQHHIFEANDRSPLYGFNKRYREGELKVIGDRQAGSRDNVDNIFALLADIEDSNPKPLEAFRNSDTRPQFQVGLQTDSYLDAHSESRLVIDASKKHPDYGTVNSLSRGVLLAGKKLEGFLQTVSKMSHIYEKEKSNMVNSTFIQRNGLPLSRKEEELPGDILDILLDPPALEKMWTNGMKSKNEDELLEAITSVILGAESRSGYGSALTLDPVTIIALLTLAAYLVRAVYQILTVTGRSLDVSDFDLPLRLSDIPEMMTNIHKWISSADEGLDSRSLGVLQVEDENEILQIPGSLAATVKLQRIRQKGCIRQFLCNHIDKRAYPSISLKDIVIAALGYYFGEKDLVYYLDLDQVDGGFCVRFPEDCLPSAMDAAMQLERFYARATNTLFSFASNQL